MKCRLCNERNETVIHILSECSKLAQTEYKKCHDEVTTMVHWELCSKYGFGPAKHWYEHRPEGVMGKQDTKILWVSTSEPTVLKRLDALTLCLLIRRIRKHSSFILVSETRRHKRLKYQDLAWNIFQMWNTKTRVIPQATEGCTQYLLIESYHTHHIQIQNC